MNAETNLPTNRPTSEVATGSPPPASNAILASDVIVPRLLLMQGTSDFVKDRKQSPTGVVIGLGDIVKSTTLEILGNPDKLIEFIPLSEPATGWRIEKRPVGNQRWEFHKNEPRNALNDGLPWKFNADKDMKPLADGVPSSHEWRRVKTLSLFAILPDDVKAYREEMAKAAEGEMPDLNKALSPVLIDFRSTSFPAGKEVSTFFSQVQQFKTQAYKYQLRLGCFLDKNDQGTFYVFKVERNNAKKVDQSYLSDVEFWVNIVRSSASSLKVDEEKADSHVETGGNF